MKFKNGVKLSAYEQPEGRSVGYELVLSKAVVSDRPSSMAAASHWARVVIWKTPLAAQLSPLVWRLKGAGGGGEGEGGGGEGGGAYDAQMQS